MTTPLEATLSLSSEAIEAIAQRSAEIVLKRLHADRSPWMTLEQAAEYLQWPKHRLYKLTGARDGIPHRKVGNRLLFHRHEVDEWLEGYREGWRPPARSTRAQVLSQPVGSPPTTKRPRATAIAGGRHERG